MNTKEYIMKMEKFYFGIVMMILSTNYVILEDINDSQMYGIFGTGFMVIGVIFMILYLLNK